MKASEALAWICAREADRIVSTLDQFLSREVDRVARTAVAIAAAGGAQEACLMLAEPYDRGALNAVWARWTSFRWAVEHPESPAMPEDVTP